MPKPSEKLRNPAQFAAVRRFGRYAEEGAFRLCVRAFGARVEGRTRRFGITASKRLVGNAVARNRAKRVFRELLRGYAHVLPPLCDVSVTVRKSYGALAFPEIADKFAKACARLAAHYAANPPPDEVARPKKAGRP